MLNSMQALPGRGHTQVAPDIDQTAEVYLQEYPGTPRTSTTPRVLPASLTRPKICMSCRLTEETMRHRGEAKHLQSIKHQASTLRLTSRHRLHLIDCTPWPASAKRPRHG